MKKKCPKCKQRIMIKIHAGQHTFNHEGKEYHSEWGDSYYCPWCNKQFRKGAVK